MTSLVPAWKSTIVDEGLSFRKVLSSVPNSNRIPGFTRNHDAELPGTVHTFSYIVLGGALCSTLASANQEHRDIVHVVLDVDAQRRPHHQS